MTNPESLPVTENDLRQALALCAAKIETEAAFHRARADAFAEGPPSRERTALRNAEIESAESCDRMAASARALLRAPKAAPSENGKRTFYRIEQYIGAEWQDVDMRYSAAELEAARRMCLNAKGASGGLRIVECRELERYREGVKQ